MKMELSRHRSRSRLSVRSTFEGEEERGRHREERSTREDYFLVVTNPLAVPCVL